MSQSSPQDPWHKRATKSYAGPTTCLRCDERFQSWDRRQNRLCPRCRHVIDAQASEEPLYTIVKPR
jgi:DNA-directed RNA polymerase subunit RPC12/RpoP